MVTLDLRPVAEDAIPDRTEGARTVWRASAPGPILVASVPGSDRIAAGWYTATARLHVRAGQVEAPCFYLPWVGDGYSEERRALFVRETRPWRGLLSAGAEEWTARFYLDRPMRRLRFAVGTRPCEFTCELRLEPLRESVGQRARRWAAERFGPVTSARPPRRRARALSSVRKRGRGLEIGPSIDPIAPKREGFRVDVIDHVDRAALLAKYVEDPVDLDRIEEVDFVWRGETYAELTGRGKHYDWIVASHVIEHSPDLVAFLADCDAILRDDGVLSLVVPDKRYVFDRFRPVTGLARVVDAHIARRRSPSAGAVAEHHLYAVMRGRQIGWYRGAPGEFELVHSPQQVHEAVTGLQESGYKDVHNWCFVPHSFRLLIEDLHALGYTRLREVSFHPTEGCEFYVTLGRQGRGPRRTRGELQQAMERELATS